MFIKTFQIFKLFGYKDINIHFESSIKIFIGENGFGKTTIMNALFSMLDAQGFTSDVHAEENGRIIAA